MRGSLLASWQQDSLAQKRRKYGVGKPLAQGFFSASGGGNGGGHRGVVRDAGVLKLVQTARAKAVYIPVFFS